MTTLSYFYTCRRQHLPCATLAVRSVCILAVVSLFLTSALGQQAWLPSIGYIYPAGAQQGTTVDLWAGGQNCSSITEISVEGPPGVHITIPEEFRIPRQQQGRRGNRNLYDILNDYERKAREENRPAIPGDPAKAAPIVTKLLRDADVSDAEILFFKLRVAVDRNSKRQANRQLDEKYIFRVVVDKDAPPGRRWIRAVCNNGITRPLAFDVGTYPETTLSIPLAYHPPDPPLEPLKFPIVLNGQLSPGQINNYTFAATRGETLIFAGQARDIMPYLADAVPGWFQLSLVILDESNTQISASQSFHFSPDPVLVFQVPATGNYRLEVRDALYRGREDFVYRITAGKFPIVSSISPLGGLVGKKKTLSIFGHNLPINSIPYTPPAQAGLYSIDNLPLSPYAHRIHFAANTGRTLSASEPDNTISDASLVTPPIIIDGAILKPGDLDCFAFKAKKDQPLILEVFARRHGSPLDSHLSITDYNKNIVAANDDQEDITAGLLTHHADSRIEFTPPADGLYYAWVSDAQNCGSPAHAYRLAIHPPEPDFIVFTTPSAFSGIVSGSAKISFQVIRQNGFMGEIHLTSKTDGFTLSPQAKIPADKDTESFTIVFPKDPYSGPVHIAATAIHTPESAASTGAAAQASDAAAQATPQTADTKTAAAGLSILPSAGLPILPSAGAEISHFAIPVDDMLQAFAYHHLVQTPSLFAHIRLRPPPTPTPAPTPRSTPTPTPTPTPKTAPSTTPQ